jgi:hypothetical protein
MSFYSVIDTSFLGDFDIRALQREQEIDELVIDLMNYIRDADYCEAVKRRGEERRGDETGRIERVAENANGADNNS